MIAGEYVMRVTCDNEKCCATENLAAKGAKWVGAEQFSAKNEGQARMGLIRAGWKFRRTKVICPACVSTGIRFKEIRRQNAAIKTLIEAKVARVPGTETVGTGDPLPANGGSDVAGVPG